MICGQPLVGNQCGLPAGHEGDHEPMGDEKRVTLDPAYGVRLDDYLTIEQVSGLVAAAEGVENRAHRAGCEKLPSISEFFTPGAQSRRML